MSEGSSSPPVKADARGMEQALSMCRVVFKTSLIDGHAAAAYLLVNNANASSAFSSMSGRLATRSSNLARHDLANMSAAALGFIQSSGGSGGD